MDSAAACLAKAREHLRAHEYDTAEPLLRRALEKDPKLSLAYELLGKLLYRASRGEEAAAVYRTWLDEVPSDPVASHLVAAMSGVGVPGRASDEFVTTLFNRAAVDFDEVLTALRYRAPQLIFETSIKVFAGAAAGIEVLDLGCGTGLCGEWLRPLARRLVGVDISPEMIAQARRRGCYDDLVCAGLSAFMPECRDRFDLVTAADVFCYFGQLTPTLETISRLLRPAGWLVFSVEDLTSQRSEVIAAQRLETLSAQPHGPSYCLMDHGRYAHDPGYIRSALASAGLQANSLTCETLRYERGEPVRGLIVAAGAHAGS